MPDSKNYRMTRRKEDKRRPNKSTENTHGG